MGKMLKRSRHEILTRRGRRRFFLYERRSIKIIVTQNLTYNWYGTGRQRKTTMDWDASSWAKEALSSKFKWR